MNKQGHHSHALWMLLAAGALVGALVGVLVGASAGSAVAVRAWAALSESVRQVPPPETALGHPPAPRAGGAFIDHSVVEHEQLDEAALEAGASVAAYGN